MATIVTMPAVLAGATEAELQSWLVSAGDTVTKGQVIGELETEKATVELEAEADGTLAKFTVEAGTSVEVGAPMAVIAAPGDTDEDIIRALESAGVDSSGAAAGPHDAQDAGSCDTSGPTATSGETAGSSDETTAGASDSSASLNGSGASDSDGERIFASPLARKIAERRGLNLSDVDGSGPNGRIIRSDVERAAQAGGTADAASNERVSGSADSGADAVPGSSAGSPGASASSGSASAADEGFVDQPVTGMRKLIAQRLTESKSTVPHFYVSVDARIDDLLELRRSINDQLAGTDTKISVNDLVLKALGNALRAVPEANVIWNGDSIRQYEAVNVGVAIAIDGGLVTPVVNDVAERTVTSVSNAVTDLRTRAETKKLRQNELEGGTFSLTNLGMYGVKDFSAIINPPHAGILAVGAGEQRPIVVDGELSVGTMLTCTLSADHRVIDGAVAARLLDAVKQQLEKPTRILM